MTARLFVFPDLPARFECGAKVVYGPAQINLRVNGPLKGGIPLMTWQGGHPMDSHAWRALRLCVEMLRVARDMDDAAVINALAAYPRIAAILDAVLVAVARERAA